MKNFKLLLFLLPVSYLLIWSMIPTLINHNIDYDLVNQYANGVSFEWSYNHPPLSFWLPAIFFEIFDRTDFNYYFLAQINVALAFFAVWQLGRYFFNQEKALICLLFLMLIPFFNTFAAKYNANSALYFPWAFSLLFVYLAIFQNKWWHWFCLGFFCALTVLAKYFALVLLLSLLSLLAIQKAREKLKQLGPYIALIVFLMTLTPHVFWIFSHTTSLDYAESKLFLDDLWSGRLDGIRYLITFPFYLLFVFIALMFSVKKLPLLEMVKYPNMISVNSIDQKAQFLWHITIFPWLIVAILSIIFNISVTGIWAMPIWLSAPLLMVYHLKKIDGTEISKLIKTSISLIIIFALLNLTYHFFKKRNHHEYSYPSKQILEQINNDWQKISVERIETIVSSDSFLAENLKFYANNDLRLISFEVFESEGFNKKNTILICRNQQQDCINQLQQYQNNFSFIINKIKIPEKEKIFYTVSESNLSLIYLP